MGLVDDEELYLEMKSELEAKIFDIKKKMEGNPEELSNLDKYVSESVTVSQNINKYWANSGVEMKKRVQELVFPNGLVLDMKNRVYLTKDVNVVFEINRVVTGGKGDKIENGSEEISEPSSVVAGTGLEPVAFGLWARRATNCSTPQYILKRVVFCIGTTKIRTFLGSTRRGW